MPRAKYHSAYPSEISDRCPVTEGCFAIWRNIELGRFYRITPTVERLMTDWGMSRATAYRWRAAIAAANGDTEPGEYQINKTETVGSALHLAREAR